MAAASTKGSRPKSPARDEVDEALLAEAEQRARALGVAKVTDLVKPAKLTARAKQELLERLAARGLVVAKDKVLVPLGEQLRAIVASGVQLPKAQLKRRLLGGSAKDKEAAIAALARTGELQIVVRTAVETVVGPDAPTLCAEELLRLARWSATLGQTLKKVVAKGGPRTMLRADLESALAVPEELARPPVGALSVDELLAELRLGARPGTDLVSIPALAARLAARAGPEQVRDALLAAANRGLVELRPETSLDLLGPAERAACIPGPRGSLLSYARLLGPSPPHDRSE
jgi:hypothetical protein